MKMLIAFASLMAFNAMAAENLGEMKRSALDKIGRDMTTLQSNKNCISGSKTIVEFNNCNYSGAPSMPMQKQESKTMDKKMDKKSDMRTDPSDMMEDQPMKNQSGY